MMYLLDANVLIDGKNRHYGFDIAPGFWDWLVQAHDSGRVFTVRAVADEIIAGGDELSRWMAARPSSFRLAPGAGDQPSLTALARWAAGHHFTAAAVSDFLSAADYFLVAQAATLGHQVVTHETSDPARRNRVKIPDACRAVGVASMTPFDMLRAEGVRLRL